MKIYEQELHIDDELFCGMREDADRVLQKLLKNMVEKDSLEGKVTIGIDVTLVREFIPNHDPDIEGETRMVLTPKFSHKVGSVMQIKNEAKGDRNCDGTELVWDEERGEYVLRPIANTEQMTIFDADFRCVNDQDGQGEDAGGNAIEGRDLAALPGPVGEGTPEDGREETENTVDMPEESREDGPQPPDVEEDGGDDGFGYEEPDDGDTGE